MLQEHEAKGDLLNAARVGLDPAPFPPRRDLEYAHVQARATHDAVLFHDTIWLRQTRFACFVVRLRGASLTRNLATAYLLRSLLRAALRKHDAASALRAGVDCLCEFDVAPQDLSIAALKLCVESGNMSLGATGCDATFLASTGSLCSGRVRDARSRHGQLEVGQRVVLAIGESSRFEPMVRDGGLPAIAADRLAPAGFDDAALSLITLRGHCPSNAHTFTLANDVAEIGPVLDDVGRCLRRQGIEPDGLLGFDVALDELLTNTILYAYRDGGAHEIVIVVRVHVHEVFIEIKDDGEPFDPTRQGDADTTSGLDDRPIGGLGLHLVRSVFDTLTYRRVCGWNALTLTLAATPDRAATGNTGEQRGKP